MIHIDNLTKRFEGQTKHLTLDHVSLDVQEGETLALIGASGCGKTTLLKSINRLIPVSSGLVSIDGQPVDSMKPALLRRQVGYVFQNVGLFPHMTLLDNVALPLRLAGDAGKCRHQTAKTYLERVGLDPERYSLYYPRGLSGGQKQRAAVARALVTEPKYLLMDEPFGAVDAITRRKLQQLLIALRDKLNKTIVIVTHDVEEARILGDRIAVMREGNMLQIGTYEQLLHFPESSYVSELLNAAESMSEARS